MKKYTNYIKKNRIIIILIFFIVIQLKFLNGTTLKNFINPLIWRENNSPIEVINSMATNMIKVKTKGEKTMIIPDLLLKSGVNSTILYYYNQYILGSNSHFDHGIYLSMYNDSGYEDITYLNQKYLKYLVMWKQDGRNGYIEIYEINKTDKKLVYTFDVNISSLYNEYKKEGLENEFYKNYKYIVNQYKSYGDITAKTYMNEFERGGSLW